LTGHRLISISGDLIFALVPNVLMKLTFYRAAKCRRGPAMRILSVCPSVRQTVCVYLSVKRVDCDNTKKICPDFYTNERTLT